MPVIRPATTSNPEKTVSHEGQVVALDSHYLGDGDSSYHAVVYIDGVFSQVHIDYYYGYHGSAIDAPAEVVAFYQAEKQAKVMMANQRAYARDDWDEAVAPRKGRQVQVVRGRKVPIGTTGEVIWYGEGQAYGYSRYPKMRVGFKVTPDAEPIWIDASNIEVVNPAQYLRDPDHAEMLEPMPKRAEMVSA
jgi:hypothetical protein